MLNVGDRRATANLAVMFDRAEKVIALDDFTLIAISGSFARSMEIGITRVMRLQFLARRLLLRRAVEEDGAGGLREDVLRPSRGACAHSAPRFSPSETAFLFRAPELERELSSYVPRTA